MAVYIGLAAAILSCALIALRASRLLTSIVWLATTSILTAGLLYMLRAYEAAVIELSVGAGLATVLLVIAFAMTGDEIQPLRPLVPRRLSYTLILAAVLLLLLLLPPHIESEAPASDAPFAVILWQQRGMDTVLQIALIFIGLVTLLGLLDEGRSANTEAEEDEVEETDAQTAQPSLEEEMMV